MSSLEIPSTDGLSTYYDLPKKVGLVNGAALVDIAAWAIQRADSMNNNGSLKFNQVAASALTEAALVWDKPGEQADERIGLIDVAETRMAAVASTEYRLLERGYRHPDDQGDWRRAELHREFFQLYRDLVCGEITDATRQELAVSLQMHHHYADRMAKYGDSARYGRGLRDEIEVIRRLMDTPSNNASQTVAFPSTARGGSGTANKSETHDVVIATLNDDSLQFDTAEVKSVRTRLQYSHLTRYASNLVSIDSSGKLRWLDKMPPAA